MYNFYSSSVPSGANNTFKMPVELMFYGRPENRQETIEKLKYYGFFLTGGSNILTGAGSSGDRLSLSAALGNRTTALSQAQVIIIQASTARPKKKVVCFL